MGLARVNMVRFVEGCLWQHPLAEALKLHVVCSTLKQPAEEDIRVGLRLRLVALLGSMRRGGAEACSCLVVQCLGGPSPGYKSEVSLPPAEAIKAGMWCLLFRESLW